MHKDSVHSKDDIPMGYINAKGVYVDIPPDIKERMRRNDPTLTLQKFHYLMNAIITASQSSY